MTDLIIEFRYYERGGWCNLFIHNHKLHIHHFLLALTVIANYGCAELISSYYHLPIDWIKYDNIIDLYGRTTFTGMHCGLLFYINSYIGCAGCAGCDVKEDVIFLVVSLVANGAFSYISSLDDLQSSLSANAEAGFVFTPVTGIVYIGAFLVTIILIVTGLYINHPSLLEITLRIAFTLWFSLWAYAFFNVFGNIHLHHTLITYVLCLWAFKKNRFHKLLFYISLGIFIQGVANYGDIHLITAYNNTGAGCAGCPGCGGKVVTETIVYKCEIDAYENICEWCFFSC